MTTTDGRDGRDGHDVGEVAALRRRIADLEAATVRLAELSESEAAFRLLLDNTQDVVFRLRFDPFEVVYCSPSSLAVLGFPPTAFTDDPELFTARTHPDDVGRLLRAQPHLPDAPERVTLRWRHAHGHWVWLEESRSPVFGPDGEMVGSTGVLRDATSNLVADRRLRAALARERAAADELRRVDAMKTTFLSAVSHELRTPLTAIVGLAETVQRVLTEGRDDVDPVRLADRIAVNADRLLHLIGDLLDQDRLARGEVDPRLGPIDLSALLREVVDRTERAGHDLHLDLPDALPMTADATMVERTFDNLLRNAVRHTPDGTTIWLGASATETTATVVVADDGPGIGASDRDRLFAPFEQGADAGRSASPGTGLGLALVERFVGVHGGRVVLDDRPGGGARFTVELPRAGRCRPG